MKNKFSPIQAVEEGRNELLKQYLDSGGSIETVDIHGKTLLMTAAICNRIDAVRLLLERGADINAADRTGFTALWWAQKNNPDLIRLLLENGAKVNACPSRPRSVLDDALTCGNIEVVGMLLRAGAEVEPPGRQGRSALQAAAASRNLELVKMILSETTCDVNYQDAGSGETALMCAASDGTAAMIELLLLNAARISMIDNNNQTALHYAAGRGNCETLAALLKNGADLEVQNKYGHTPLITAASNRHHWKEDEQCERAVNLMLQYTVAIDATDSYGWTALHHAAYDGHTRTTERLIRDGAAIHIKNKDKKTPLALAIATKQRDPYNDRMTIQPETKEHDKYYEVIRVLVEAEGPRGLHPSTRDALIKVALETRCPEVLELLGYH